MPQGECPDKLMKNSRTIKLSLFAISVSVTLPLMATSCVGDEPIVEDAMGGAPAMGGASMGAAGGNDAEGSSTDPTVAMSESFDDWEPGSRGFNVTNGDASAYDKNGTLANVDGQECLWIQGRAADNNGYGFSVEFELALDQHTDMSGEDYEVAFDVYVPTETYEKGPNVQFSLFETENFTPIYSAWYSSSLEEEQWVRLTTPINTTDGLISYSGFDENPGDWAFDVVRIQTIINAETAALGDEISFCIDNLEIRQIGTEDTDSSEDPNGEDANQKSPYTVTANGTELSVQRVGKFDVPVNYVRLDDPGSSTTFEVSMDEPIEQYTLSPASEGISGTLTEGVLSFSVNEPAYLILEVPGEERLFVLVDPPEEEVPELGDSNVRNLMDYDGVDSTGGTEISAVLQEAIDEASGAVRNILYVPEGTYLTRSLSLKDDMTLYLAEGAVLKNATPQADLLSNAEGLTVIEGASHGFIVMSGVSNARLMGRGTLDGNGVELQGSERKMFLVKIENSSDCVVDGVISRDSAFWNTMIYRSDNISIRNYKVINNQLAGEWNETDGVDFNNCTNSSLENAFLYTGDDCMAVKSDDIPDEMEVEGIVDPTTGAYRNVAEISHEDVVCHSASSACKVGTKTFGQTMSNIVYRDIDVITAGRGLVIDAVDTAEITGTVFEDIRVESVSGRLVDFNMDPEAITWRTNPGICTVTNTSVLNLSSAESASLRMQGNIHNWNESDPYYGQEYFINGVTFDSLTIEGEVITSLDDPNASFETNEYVTDVAFLP